MDAVELTRELVAFDTRNPPGDERDCAAHLSRLLADCGLRVESSELSERRTSLVARLPGAKGGRPLAFTGHLDVVPLGAAAWRRDPFAGEVDGDLLYGRGATDMKAGIAAFLQAVAETCGAGARPAYDVELILTAGEETGCEGARALARDSGLLRDVSALIVGEPTANRPAVGHKGALWLEATTAGVTAHGSQPSAGRNAIYAAARAIVELERYGFDERLEHAALGRPTLNVGTIRGGMNVNSVPDASAFTVDVRTIPSQEHAEVLEALRRRLGEEVGLRPFVDVEGLWTDPRDPWVQRVHEVVEAVTGERTPEPRGASFFTDGPLLKRACGDPPVVVLGPGEPGQAHQTDEHCRISRIREAVEIYRRLIEQWNTP